MSSDEKIVHDVLPLPTIWEVPDGLWEIVEALLAEYDPAPRMGRPRINQRNALNGVIYRVRTGCQWNVLPKEFGDDVSIYRTLQRWESRGIFEKMWAVLVTRCDLLGGVDWEWQSADGALGKARGIKKGRPKGAKNKKTRPVPVLEPIPRIVASVGSKKAFSSKAEATRWALSLPERTSMTTAS
jgi:transposase